MLLVACRKLMSKQVKILSVLFVVIAAAAALYLLKTAESVAPLKEQVGKLDKKLNEKTEKIDLERVKAQYKEDVKGILSDYSFLINKPDVTADQIQALKNRLLDLKVPSIFKDLHINLVLAMTRMENFLSNGNKEDKFFSQEMIEKNKEKYNWLK